MCSMSHAMKPPTSKMLSQMQGVEAAINLPSLLGAIKAFQTSALACSTASIIMAYSVPEWPTKQVTTVIKCGSADSSV